MGEINTDKCVLQPFEAIFGPFKAKLWKMDPKILIFFGPKPARPEIFWPELEPDPKLKLCILARARPDP